MITSPELIQKINEALDRTRFAHHISTDKDLALLLSVSTKTVSFWRRGHLTRADRALAAVLTNSYHPHIATTISQPTD